MNYFSLTLGLIVCLLTTSSPIVYAANVENPSAEANKGMMNDTDSIFSPGGWESYIATDEETVTSGGWGVMQGIRVDVITQAPSFWGLLWRDIKERAYLAMTFNNMDKAKLQLKYAEERLRLAERFAASDLETTRSNAHNMMKRDDKLMQDLEDTKTKWLREDLDEGRRMMMDVATHAINQQVAWDIIESQSSVDSFEEFLALRQTGQARAQRMIVEMQKKQLLKDEYTHLRQIKAHIALRQEETEQFQAQCESLNQANEINPADFDQVKKEIHKQLRDHISEHWQIGPGANTQKGRWQIEQENNSVPHEFLQYQWRQRENQ